MLIIKKKKKKITQLFPNNKQLVGQLQALELLLMNQKHKSTNQCQEETTGYFPSIIKINECWLIPWIRFYWSIIIWRTPC